MILIAHRGNIEGKNKFRENKIDYILEALEQGYDVEIDIRFIKNCGEYFLGHDEAQEICPNEILYSKNTWVHAKDIYTFERLLDIEISNSFFHTNEDVVLTSSGYLWTYPGKTLTVRSIQVMPEYVGEEFSEIPYGICSDWVKKYRNS